jgi:hypothetical protein
LISSIDGILEWQGCSDNAFASVRTMGGPRGKKHHQPRQVVRRARIIAVAAIPKVVFGTGNAIEEARSEGVLMCMLNELRAKIVSCRKKRIET